MAKRIQSRAHLLREKMAIATAMMESGYTGDQIRLRTGLSKDTLTRLKRGQTAAKPTLGQIEVARKTVEEYRSAEAEKLSRANELILDHMLSDDGKKKIEKAGLRESAGALRDMIQQRELLTGRPTTRHEETLSDKQILAEIMKAKRELAGLGVTEYEDIQDAEFETVTRDSLPSNGPDADLAAHPSCDEVPSDR